MSSFVMGVHARIHVPTLNGTNKRHLDSKYDLSLP